MEYVILVDENDNKIWTMEKLEAHQRWLLHRCFSLFVFNDKWELLLQQRDSGKYHCWGLWSNTVCSHQRDWENTVKAAERRVIEEMWFTCKNPKIVHEMIYRAEFDNGLIEHEYDYVLIWKYNWEDIKPNSEEVMDYKWIDLKDLKKDIEKNPEIYTPWIKIIIRKDIF